jgi:hypothetical protein
VVRIHDPEVDMRERERQIQAEETEHFTGGPGVVATKSQARGATGGFLAGAVAGALVGLLIGLLMFEARGVIIATVSLAVAGAVFGGVAGGIGRSMKKLERTEADT